MKQRGINRGKPSKASLGTNAEEVGVGVDVRLFLMEGKEGEGNGQDVGH